jgi:hypothetical protein
VTGAALRLHHGYITQSRQFAGCLPALGGLTVAAALLEGRHDGAVVFVLNEFLCRRASQGLDQLA